MYRNYLISSFVFIYLFGCIKCYEESDNIIEYDNGDDTQLQSSNRDSRYLVFPFLQLNIPESACTTTNNQNGTCLSTSQMCGRRGGTVDGLCPGFGLFKGVCCILENRCNAVVSGNGSVLVNNEYPNAISSVGNCQYVINKLNQDICQIRLDFDELVLMEPSNVTSLCEKDKFTFTGASGRNPPVICGTLSGQSMYIDLPTGDGSARINIATIASAISIRKWKIRVTQYTCNSEYKAPTGCLQYFSAITGRVSSYNFQATPGVHQIGDTRYAICFRAADGFCGINFQNEGFSMSGDAATPTAASGETDCTADFVSTFVLDKNSVPGVSRYCGSNFTALTTYAQPFILRVNTDNIEPDTDINNAGFSLRYTLLPC